ncbi:interferon-induced, double-stranded RNA-activated protein kinase-like isoform X2 [Narcine bancroftii]|uniref:interferon-induced, double-stranded RNA-activated protein kinase-like isoform X2 n=1 Tax=Narcine bancroftii TaxID=1343680 RepID=UPI00383205D5
MTTTGPTSSTVSFLYMEKLQLYAGRIEKPLIWLESQSGPPHDLVFTTCAKIGDDIYPKAEAKTKKKAKHNAAKCACEALNLHSESNLSFARTPSPLNPAGIQNYISKLNEYGQKEGLRIHYNMNQLNTGLDHIQRFSCSAVINNYEYPKATGGSKQEAKRKAAELAYKKIHNLQSPSKDLEKLQEDVNNQKEPNGTVEESAAENSKREDADNGYKLEPSISSLVSSSGSRVKRPLAPTWTSSQDSRESTGNVRNSLREVKSLAQMDHPNIVRYYTCWLEESFHNKKTLYIQMKLYKTNLRVWMEEFQNNLPRQKQISRDLMHQLLDGVHYIHQKKMVHRDLKPANILLSEEEGKLEAKIGDFGLVRVCNQGLHTVNVGTPAYMSPEQRRADYYDYKVDIFALGLIFFDLLWIYYGTASEKIKCWEEIRKGVFDEKFVEELPIESALIRQMLLENARDRPEADEVKQTLISSDAQTNR